MPHIKLLISGVHEVSTWVDDADWDQLTPSQRQRLLAGFVRGWHHRRWPDTGHAKPLPDFRWELL